MTLKKKLLILTATAALAGGILLMQKNQVLVEGNMPAHETPLKLAVVSASPTIAGHGFETALDANPNDGYVAGIEGNKHFVVLQLNQPTDLAAIDINWYSEKEYARKVTITTSGAKAGEPDRVLAKVDGLNSKNSHILLKGATAVQDLKIVYDDYAGQQRVLLRQIRLQPVSGKQEKTVAVEQKAAVTLVPLTLLVDSASPTVTGHGFETALDGNPNDSYVAGIEGNKHFVVLQIDRSSDLAAIEIEWYNEKDYARKVTIKTLGSKAGEADRVLAEVDGLNSKVSRIPLKDAMGVKTLKIEFDDYAGQQRVLLRQIRLSHWY